MEQKVLQAAQTLIIDRLESEGIEVESVKALQKSSHAILVKVTRADRDGEEYAVVTRDEVS